MTKKTKKINFVFIMILYLLGIFMGAIDTGIVTPARTVIQNYFMVDDKTGIWMITMYTLAYAASIPIMGKLADKYGRKYIYLFSIFLFGFGSLLCGLSQNFGSFTFLLIARAIQAIGGGGILPVATAEFGTTFPKEKRGMALGLVGGVYGVANIFGASAGSAILDLFGTNNWQFIFYVNVPITIFILICGILYLPNTKAESVKKIDLFGISILTVMILSVLYGLKKIDFFDFTATLTSTSVYPFLILFIVLLPVFIFTEKRVEDPVMNLTYFKNIKIIITLILSFMTGVILMGMIFVPEFSENSLKISSGSGGYLVLILGVFAGLGAPVSGKLIDKHGVKLVLGFGFLVSAIGSLFLVLVTTNYPNMLTVVISLMFVGLGIGFTMGTPLNYMMLDNTKQEEANSALATVSLVRSIGTAIAPAIMIGFISHAGTAVQTNVMPLLPSEVNMPELPYVQELSKDLETLKTNPQTKEKLADVNIPDFALLQKIEINMNPTSSNFVMPNEVIERLQSSDVTTITEDCKYLADIMFNMMTPGVVENIQSGIKSGITAMKSTSDEMNTAITSMQFAAKSQTTAIEQLVGIKRMLQGQTSSIAILDLIPDAAKSNIPETVLTEIRDIKSGTDLDQKIKGLEEAKHNLSNQIDSITVAKEKIGDDVTKMTELNNAIPKAFETAKNSYLEEIDNLKETIETNFQETMNGGFKQVYLTVTIVSVLSLIILAFYKNNRKRGEEVGI